MYIFVDEFFPKDVRSSAQGLFNVLILGFGPFVGEPDLRAVGGDLQDRRQARTTTAIFQYSMGAALIGAIILALFFHPPKDV